MRRYKIAGLLLASLALTPACESEPTEQSVPVCQPVVTLSVALQTPPVFSWSPTCRAEVLSLTGPGRLWALIAANNSLVSPITYGAAPSGAITLGLADPLESGVEYTVVLERMVPPLAFDTVGTLRFTP